MEIRNNSNINFSAKLSLVGDLAKSSRWQKIAKEFEAKTSKEFPNYELSVSVDNPEYMNKFFIAIDRGESDDLCMRGHILNDKATEKILRLSENKVIKKLTKLLNIVKNRDDFMDAIPFKMAKIEEVLGIDLSQKTYDLIYDLTRYDVNSKNRKILSRDSVLSKYHDSFNIMG